MTRPARRATPVAVTRALLRRMALPEPDAGGSKDERGRVFVVGGSVPVPGALVLAGTAALRAGAGKLTLATCARIAPLIGVAVPEALVMGLATTRSGGIAPAAATPIIGAARQVNALLIGPGMMNDRTTTALVARVVRRLESPTLVLDAGALSTLIDQRDALRALGGNIVLTPHAGEMASMLGISESEVAADALGIARRAARELGATVALKGATTFVATPDGTAYRYDGGNVGLATSGSGDTLAGIVAGLAARGATPVRAALWGVYLHGAAGNALARRLGPLGFLARELLDEVPALMARA